MKYLLTNILLLVFSFSLHVLNASHPSLQDLLDKNNIRFRPSSVFTTYKSNTSSSPKAINYPIECCNAIMIPPSLACLCCFDSCLRGTPARDGLEERVEEFRQICVKQYCCCCVAYNYCTDPRLDNPIQSYSLLSNNSCSIIKPRP